MVKRYATRTPGVFLRAMHMADQMVPQNNYVMLGIFFD